MVGCCTGAIGTGAGFVRKGSFGGKFAGAEAAWKESAGAGFRMGDLTGADCTGIVGAAALGAGVGLGGTG